MRIEILQGIKRSLWELVKERKKLKLRLGGVRIKIVKSIENISIIDGNKKLISSFEFWDVAEK